MDGQYLLCDYLFDFYWVRDNLHSYFFFIGAYIYHINRPTNTIIFWNLIVQIFITIKMHSSLKLLRYQVWLSDWGTNWKCCLDTIWILILFLLRSLSSWESSTPPRHLLFLLRSNITKCTIICISQISSFIYCLFIHLISTGHHAYYVTLYAAYYYNISWDYVYIGVVYNITLLLIKGNGR